MARGNQRDKAREKNQKELSAQVSFPVPTRMAEPPITWTNQLRFLQKKKNNVSITGSIAQPSITAVARSDPPGQQTGTEFQRTKEQQAAIMRQKQEEGKFISYSYLPRPRFLLGWREPRIAFFFFFFLKKEVSLNHSHLSLSPADRKKLAEKK